ncbi:amidase family protein [Gemella morbillorum]|uniref:amidase family protein n=1 Tax=Gemella morbillorum TaxID=29391 RepID=UPI0028D689D3|nr:amidase family protein [Gemella morbillorum]
MKKTNLKYVLIPAFAATAFLPILDNSNSAKANEEIAAEPTSQNANTTKIDNPSSINNKELPNKLPLSLVEYKQKSALELAKLIREKKVTSTELVDLAYKVIEEENKKLNAVLTTENGKIPQAIVDEAYKEAKEIDNRITAGNASANPINWDEQPFLGVPTLIKGLDQIKNGDASNGVYFNKNKVSKSDLMVAKEFKKLGFIILGQTNYPELGTRNITDSKLFGPAGNPWDSTRNAGGSSGGSASAVSSGMVAIASGSDAGGSIRIPASWTGLIGLKPTGHVVKFPLVKDINDAKVYFDKTKINKPKTLIDVPKNLKTLKIAYSLKTPLKDVELSEDGKKAVLKAVAFLREQGFTVEEVNEFPIDGYEGIRTYTVGAIGGAYAQAAKLADENTKYNLDPATYALGTSVTKGPNANTDISDVKPVSVYKKQMDEFYKKYDLFLMSTNAVTAPSNDKKVDPYVDPEIEKKLYNINDIKDPKERFNLLVKQWEPMMKRTPYTWLFNLTGNPAITLPVYKSANNLPLGVMFAAQDNSEKILLEMGKLFQDNNQFVMHENIKNSASTINGNKIAENTYGTKFEYNVPSEAPSVPTLPELELNDSRNTVTIKLPNGISVEVDNKLANGLNFEAQDITNNLNLNEIINKILEDKNNNINSRDEISTIRVLDLKLTEDNNKLSSDTKRIVQIKLLENEIDKDILVYHIKDDNSLELVKSTVSNGILTYTTNHFSKFVIIGKTKISHQIDSSSSDNVKKFSLLDNKGDKNNSKNNILPKTGIAPSSNVSLGLILILIISALLRFKKALK